MIGDGAGVVAGVASKPAAGRVIGSGDPSPTAVGFFDVIRMGGAGGAGAGGLAWG